MARPHVEERNGWPSPDLLQVFLSSHRSLLQIARLTRVLRVRERVVTAARFRNRVIDVGSVGCRRLRPNRWLAAEDTRITALRTRGILNGLRKCFASARPSGRSNFGRALRCSPRFK